MRLHHARHELCVHHGLLPRWRVWLWSGKLVLRHCFIILRGESARRHRCILVLLMSLVKVNNYFVFRVIVDFIKGQIFIHCWRLIRLWKARARVEWISKNILFLLHGSHTCYWLEIRIALVSGLHYLVVKLEQGWIRDMNKTLIDWILIFSKVRLFFQYRAGLKRHVVWLLTASGLRRSLHLWGCTRFVRRLLSCSLDPLAESKLDWFLLFFLRAKCSLVIKWVASRIRATFVVLFLNRGQVSLYSILLSTEGVIKSRIGCMISRSLIVVAWRFYPDWFLSGCRSSATAYPFSFPDEVTKLISHRSCQVRLLVAQLWLEFFWAFWELNLTSSVYFSCSFARTTPATATSHAGWSRFLSFRASRLLSPLAQLRDRLRLR